MNTHAIAYLICPFEYMTLFIHTSHTLFKWWNEMLSFIEYSFECRILINAHSLSQLWPCFFSWEYNLSQARSAKCPKIIFFSLPIPVSSPFSPPSHNFSSFSFFPPFTPSFSLCSPPSPFLFMCVCGAGQGQLSGTIADRSPPLTFALWPGPAHKGTLLHRRRPVHC